MTNFDTAEILEAQVAMLERLQSQATRTMLSQATISKRQLLNFVSNVDEFVKDFMALNQRTINIIRGVNQDGKENENREQLGDAGSDKIGDPASGEIAGGTSGDQR